MEVPFLSQLFEDKQVRGASRAINYVSIQLCAPGKGALSAIWSPIHLHLVSMLSAGKNESIVFHRRTNSDRFQNVGVGYKLQRNLSTFLVYSLQVYGEK